MRKIRIIKEEKHTYSAQTLDFIRQDLNNALADLPIELVILFGSYAGGRATRLSDLDLAVRLEPGLSTADEAEILLVLYEIFSRIFKREDIDITILNHAGVLLCYRVLREGLILYGDTVKFLNFSVKARRDYLDMKPLLEFYHNHFTAGG